MDNLVINITLPKGLALTTGAVLTDDQTVTVVGSITPWYASTDMVRTEGGIYLAELGDLAIAAEIYKISREVDTLTCVNPHVPHAGMPATSAAVKEYNNFLWGREVYVSKKAAFNCILNIFDLAGARGSKTLGNFSVTRMSFAKGESMPHKTDELKKEYESWRIVIQSAGHIGAGGTAKSTFASKGLYRETQPGRLWMNTGMGANHKSIPGFGQSGKPVKYASAPFTQWRLGRFVGSYMSVLPQMGGLL